MIKNYISTVKAYLLPLFMGALFPLAFAPFNQFWIAWIIPAVLAYLLQEITVKQAGLRGLLFGLGYFGVGVSWVYISVHVYGQTPMITAALITLGFVLVLSLFTAGFCASFVLLTRRRFSVWNFVSLDPAYKPRDVVENDVPDVGNNDVPRLVRGIQRIFATSFTMVIYASLWVLWEWLRGWIFTGFPWLFIGYTQIDSPLSGFAPLVGIYGVSWLTVLFSGLLLHALISWKTASSAKKTKLIISLVLIPLCGGLLSLVSWTTPKGEPTQVTLVQPNTPQDMKWVGNHGAQIVTDLIALSAPALTTSHRIIIWPEAAIPYTISQVKPMLDVLSLESYALSNTLITGILNQAPDHNNQQRFYNSIIAVGKGDGIYYKQHLVPFGEYIPFESQLGRLLQVLALPLPSITPGPAHQTGLRAGNLSIAPAICYEVIYPALVFSNFKATNADLLLTISNDTWFGTSIGPHQHLQMARMRALELGRYMIRATNNGISAIMNDKGDVMAQLPQFEATTLESTVQAMQSNTPLVWYGHGTIILIIAVILGVVSLKVYRHH